MTIYKVENENGNTVIGYYLNLSNAQRCVREVMAWFADSFHIESQIIEISMGLARQSTMLITPLLKTASLNIHCLESHHK